MSALFGAAAAREIVATEVKEEGEDGEQLLIVEEEDKDEVEEEEEGVVCFVGWRELSERGQQKRSWKWCWSKFCPNANS